MLAYSENDNFRLTDKQKEAIDLIGGHENILLYGGSRSTKTFTHIRTIVIRALAAPKSRHAVVRLRFNHVKQSVVYDTFPKVMELCFPEIPYRVDKQDWFVKLPNGSEIWFGGLDDKERTEKILGNEYATILLNECSQISFASYTVVETRLAQVCTYRDGSEIKTLSLKMLLDENPPLSGHWTYKMFIQGKDPLSKRDLPNKEEYACLLMNPVDNADNLPKSYLNRLQNLPKRQRDRFWSGKFGDANENALWSQDTLDSSRVNGDDLPEMVRIVVPVDPSGADDDENKNNDDIGIGVVGLGTDGNAYVFEDLTINAGPATWGKVVAQAYERHEADRVIGEANYGGAMVEFVVKTASPNISYKSVSASRGKVVRAEPAAALHETGKIKLVGQFDELEDELLAFTTTGYTGAKSPNRADWFVWG
ncbi:MAG: DNA-packaging protein, partial [Planctomycetes bacterium]|nr:DNA-packaging protein [Planctomycetota bacterium]